MCRRAWDEQAGGGGGWYEDKVRRVWQEISPTGSRCPGPRCSTTILASVPTGNTLEPLHTASPLAGLESTLRQH